MKREIGWITKDGKHVAIRELSDAHLRQILRMLRHWPRMPRRKLLIAECSRRGMPIPGLGYPTR